MRYGKAFNTLCPEVVHPLPQVLWILRVKPGKGFPWQPFTAFEDDVAMQITVIRGGWGVFKAHKGGKFSWFIEPVSRVDSIHPGTTDHLSGFGPVQLTGSNHLTRIGEEGSVNPQPAQNGEYVRAIFIRCVEVMIGLGKGILRERRASI